MVLRGHVRAGFTVGRGSVRLIVYGLQLVWSEQDGERSGSDLDVWPLYLARIKGCVSSSVSRPSHHTACNTTPMQGKTTEWFTCMGGAARCLMSDVHWGSAVGTVAGPPAQGGIEILGGVPLFQEQIVEVVLTVAVCWVD